MDNQQITALKFSRSPNLAPYQIIVTKEDNKKHPAWMGMGNMWVMSLRASSCRLPRFINAKSANNNNATEQFQHVT